MSDPPPESPVVGHHPVEIARSPPQGQLHPTNPFLRGPPQNRPPRPAPEEYGVRPERRAGPPPAAAGAHPGGDGLARDNSAPTRPVRPALDNANAFTFPFQAKPESPSHQQPNFPFANDGPLRSSPDGEAVRARPPPISTGGLNGSGSPPASPPAIGGGAEWPLASPVQPPARPRTLDRDRPPQLNLAFQAGDYAQEIGDGPWTPPLPPPARLVSPDEMARPSTATGGSGGPGSFSFGHLTPIGPPGGAGPIGMARGPSIRRDAAPEGEPHGQRRPDHGLANPTGFSDSFGVTFI